MYRKCPKCGFERAADDRSDAGVCPACGLVFAKWVSRTLGGDVPAHAADADESRAEGHIATLMARLTSVAPRTDPTAFWGRVVAYGVLFVWGWSFIVMNYRGHDIMNSFMHRIDLVFHEAGHVIFIPFGSFMTILGGTLGQLLMPVVVMVALVVTNRDNFGGSVGLWWLGQSLMDCAPYIADARALQLPLLGGGTGQDRPGAHDWENILLDLNLIQHDLQIGAAAHVLGAIVMLTAFAWGGYILVKQYRNMETG